MSAKKRPVRTAKENPPTSDQTAVTMKSDRHLKQEKKEAVPMKPMSCTLLELIQSVNAFTQNDREVAVVVAHLVNSGRVRLRGNFAGMKIRLSPSRPAQTSAS
jgi:hypothetical protein